MKIEKLKLKNYRNYDKLDISFNNNLNIIIGNNAQGKTNILEAIYFLSITKSFLSVNDSVCIKNNQLMFKIEGNIISNDNNNKLSILLNSNEKKIKINSKEIIKHSDYIGKLKVILFNPDNVRLIKDSPNNRRRFLNIEISQLDKKYLNTLNQYNLLLKQRNEYLKTIKFGKNNEIYFDILTDKLVELSKIIYESRKLFIDKINLYISNIFENISGYENLYIKYLPNIDLSDKKNMLEKLKANYDREVLYGNTLIGPHRDDFSFKLGDNDLILYGSQGQLKMAILALKLAELDVFYEYCGEYPILLLDDLFSELDLNKRNKVIKFLNKDIQVIITTTDLKNIDKRIIKNAVIYKINDGKIIS